MIIKLLFAIGSTTFLCSCATTTFETSVTKFHQLPPKGKGETFVISAPLIKASLETEQHLSRLANGLVVHGWTQAGSKNYAYKVAIDYGISNGRTVHGIAPIIGQTGGGTTYHSGITASGSYSGTSYTPATFGVVGAVPTAQTVFDRYLLVIIFDRKGRTVLEGRCSSSGSSPNLSDVVPRMIDSFLTDFPGESGTTKTYSKP